MACYDCEDCNKHISNGGKCNKFEYDCPYDLVSCTDIDNVKQIQQKAIEIKSLIKDIEHLDEEGMLWCEISTIRIKLDEIIDFSTDNVINEWKEIN